MIEATIISKDVDTQRGTIRVWTQYKLDGVEIPSQYPKIDGKSVYCVRYDPVQLVGLTEAEIEAKVLADLDSHAGSLIRNKFRSLVTSDALNTGMANIIGKTVQKDTTQVKVGDKDYNIKDDGSFSVV